MSITKTLSAIIVLSFTLLPLQAKENKKATPTKTKKVVKKTTPTKAKKVVKKTTPTKAKKVVKKTAPTKAKKEVKKTTPTTAKKEVKKTTPNSTNQKTTTTKGITVADPKTAAANKKSAATLSSSQRKSMLNTFNKGTSADLIKVPGLGEKTIALIKKARPYKDVTDLGNVTGIGQKKFSAIVKHFKSKK